jgi:hypothetical protein
MPLRRPSLLRSRRRRWHSDHGQNGERLSTCRTLAAPSRKLRRRWPRKLSATASCRLACSPPLPSSRLRPECSPSSPYLCGPAPRVGLAKAARLPQRRGIIGSLRCSSTRSGSRRLSSKQIALDDVRGAVFQIPKLSNKLSTPGWPKAAHPQLARQVHQRHVLTLWDTR